MSENSTAKTSPKPGRSSVRLKESRLKFPAAERNDNVDADKSPQQQAAAVASTSPPSSDEPEDASNPSSSSSNPPSTNVSGPKSDEKDPDVLYARMLPEASKRKLS